MPKPATDHRRAIAERNIQAILDAAEALLERHSPPSRPSPPNPCSRASPSTPTSPTVERLLEAVVERAVHRSTIALHAAEPDIGPVVDALERVIGAAWRELDRHAAIAEGAAARLRPDALTRAHEAGHRWLHDLIERGRAEGAFRTDLPTDWLVATCFAVIHACGQRVRAASLDAASAPDVLTATIRAILMPAHTR